METEIYTKTGGRVKEASTAGEPTDWRRAWIWARATGCGQISHTHTHTHSPPKKEGKNIKVVIGTGIDVRQIKKNITPETRIKGYDYS